MASVQCYKTCEQSCQQKSHHGSLGQKVPDLFKGHHQHSNASNQTQTKCYSQTQVHSQSGHVTSKAHIESCYSQTETHATKSNRGTRKVHRRNLLQKIKYGLSGHSSDSGSSSESESDSDNKNCQKRKAELN